MGEPKTLADRVQAASIESRMAESEVDEVLHEATGGYYEWWSDWYDNSIEVHMTGEGPPSAALLKALWSMGFAQAWFHYDTGAGREWYAHSPGESASITPNNESRREPGNPDELASRIRRGRESDLKAARSRALEWFDRWVEAVREATARAHEVTAETVYSHDSRTEWEVAWNVLGLTAMTVTAEEFTEAVARTRAGMEGANGQ